MRTLAGQVLDLGTDQLVGRFFPSSTRGPGVLALSGSDGGCPIDVGRRLAAEGFSCLALRYFRARGLPRHLVEVPLDYVGKALGWLQRQPSVTQGGVGVIGVSKGAELALLCSTYFPEDVSAVVAYAPSAVAFAGISSLRGDGWRRSSWSYRGKPVPFVPYSQQHFRPTLSFRGLVLAPIYRAALEDSAAVAEAAIAIESTDASFLLISGGRDQMWPSKDMAEMLVSRMQRQAKQHKVQHMSFSDAGHGILRWVPDTRPPQLGRALSVLPLLGIGGVFALGGTPSANRSALEEAWTTAVGFLSEHLSPQP